MKGVVNTSELQERGPGMDDYLFGRDMSTNPEHRISH